MQLKPSLRVELQRHTYSCVATYLHIIMVIMIFTSILDLQPIIEIPKLIAVDEFPCSGEMNFLVLGEYFDHNHNNTGHPVA